MKCSDLIENIKHFHNAENIICIFFFKYKMKDLQNTGTFSLSNFSKYHLFSFIIGLNKYE